MTLANGSRLGTFEILGPLGRGGMGEVYRARDGRLGRQVAIKVLPEAVARDPERLLRFEREAKALAALRHPNVATLHGFFTATAVSADGHGRSLEDPAAASGESEHEHAISYLVMELIEGETLAERIARGRISWGEAAAIFDGIADGLKAAHESGIVHRDLKPANVKLDDEGRPKVLDFGLALSADPGGAAADASAGADQSPTLTAPATMPGMLLGTAAYMAPEQARGRRVDRRCDVWAFGCCLYEALTGARAFDGEDASLTLAAILTEEPDWGRLPADLPPSIAALVRRCLEKDPRRRLQDLADARWWLAEASDDARAPARHRAAVRSHPGILLGAVGAALAAGAAAGWLAASRPAARGSQVALAPPVARFEVIAPLAVPSDFAGRQIAVHPSGTSIAFAATGGVGSGASRSQAAIYLHDVRAGAARMISGTEGGQTPFFSSSGDWLGFVGAGGLFKVPAAGGLAQHICALPANPLAGFDWRGDEIAFGVWSGPRRGLWRVTADGGDPERFGDEPALQNAVLPSFVADRDAILFTHRVEETTRFTVRLLDLRTGAVSDLGLDGSAAQYLDSGHLVWSRGLELWAAVFDLDTLRPVGEARPVLSLPDTGRTSAPFAASVGGTLAALDHNRLELAEIELGGARRLLPTDPGLVNFPRYSADGRSVAYQRGGLGFARVWIHELESGRESALSGERNQVFPEWCPDGRLVYFSNTAGGFGLFVVDPEAGAEPTLVLEDQEAPVPQTVSVDGVLLVRRGLERSLWRVDLANPGSAEPWLEDRAGSAAFSPDGRWVAYDSDHTGRREVYLRPFPGPGAARPVSVGGGSQPAWRADGRALYFVSPRGLEELELHAGAGGLALGTARMAMELPAELAVFEAGPPRRGYDLRPDGRALIAALLRDEPMRIQVVLNFGSELRERLSER